MTRGQKAGQAIAAGAYGCVFKPPLKCNDPSIYYDPTGVSKLMTFDHANNEMNEVKRIQPIINSIPNNEKYFLTNKISICSPANLTTEDKVRFDKTCKNLTKHGIKESNVNRKLSILKILNIPYGGEDLNIYEESLKKITNKQEVLSSFVYTNKAMLNLLKNGILPMHQRGLYHFDIKAGNILREGTISSKNPKLRLIDWGLSVITTPDELKRNASLPSFVQVIQFNVPFSNILFSMESQYVITKNLMDIKTNNIGRQGIMRAIAANILGVVLTRSGPGHIDFVRYDLNRIYKPLLNPNFIRPNLSLTELLKNTFGNAIIIDYLAEVLDKYVKETIPGKYEFEGKRYFEEVYLKNVDIWGFLMSYLVFLKINPSNEYTYDWDDKLTNHILRILLEYCFNSKYAATPMPIYTIIKELENLNKITGINTASPSSGISKAVLVPTKKTITKSTKKIKGFTIKDKSKTLKVKKLNLIPSVVRVNAERKKILKQPFTWPKTRRCPKGYRGKTLKNGKKICVVSL
jgi:hypothetical protein